MTSGWTGWFLQNGETDSLSYDFGEARPAWKSWWFRIGFAAACVCLLWLSGFI